MASGSDKNARKRMFHDGQLFDIATVVQNSGEPCLDLGLLLGDGFGRCVTVRSVIDSCEGNDSVEVRWNGGSTLSVSNCLVCHLLSVQDHSCCE